MSIWTKFLRAHPEQLRSHIQRDSHGRVDDDNVRGYVWVNRMTHLESVIRDTRMRKKVRAALFRRFALLFASAENYQAELRRVGVQPAPLFAPAPYNGSIPPTEDDVVRHAARSGIAPEVVHPALTNWSAVYLGSASTTGEAAQPTDPQPGQAEDEAPAAATHGLGAATPGGEATTTLAAPASGASHVTERDVEMQDHAPA